MSDLKKGYGKIGEDPEKTKTVETQDASKWKACAADAFLELSRAMTSEFSIEEISEIVLRKAADLTESPKGYACYIESSSGGMKTVCLMDGKESEDFGRLLEQEASLMKDGLPIIENSPSREEGIMPRRFMAVPVRAEKKPLGLILIADARNEYKQEHLTMMECLAAFYAAGIQRIRGREDLAFARNETAKAVQNRNDFLSTMSHEVRTPMNGILGMLELALENELPPRQKEHLALALNSAETLLTLLNNFFNFSDIEVGKLKIRKFDFSLRSMIDSVMFTMKRRAEAKNLSLILEIDEKVPDLLIGDPDRIRHVLANLLGNAVKFTESGSIKFTVAPYQEGSQKTEKGIDLLFSIEDTGIGIPEARRKNLFHSFAQVDASIRRAYGGAGIGLAISRKIIEMMSGKIWMESRENTGSTFFFTAWFDLQKAGYAKKKTDLIPPPPLVSKPERKIIDFEKSEYAKNIGKWRVALEQFIETVPLEIRRLRNAMDEGEMNFTEHIAQKIKKQAARIGALKMADDAFRLKLAARKGDRPRLENVIGEIENDLILLREKKMS